MRQLNEVICPRCADKYESHHRNAQFCRAASTEQLAELAVNTAPEIIQPELGCECQLHRFVKSRVAWLPLEIEDVIRLVSKAQNALIFFCQIMEKRGVENQGMIAVILDIVFRQRNIGIMVVVEAGQALLKDWR